MIPAYSRRDLLRASAAGLGALALAADKPRFNVNDYHVHLDQKFTLNDAAALAKQLGVKFGIAEHAGSREYPYPNLIDTDDKLNAWIDFLENRPVWKGVQAEGIDWWRQFSKELIIRLDYCLGDAMTFIEKDGRQVRLWVPEQVKISSPQDFMDRYTAFNVEVLNKSPLDIFAHPTYLPEVLQKDFDALWTRERMAKVVDAAKRNGVAIEIDAEFQLPRAPFLEMARKAGLKFSFGANIRPGTASRLDWCIATAERYGLGNQDLFVPAAQEQKPLLRRGFAHP